MHDKRKPSQPFGFVHAHRQQTNMTLNPHKHLQRPYSQIPHAGTRPIRLGTRHPQEEGLFGFFAGKI
jgi:hypothetical protein